MAIASAGALALDGDLGAVETLLTEQGDGVINVADEDGRTMLHWASSGGHGAMVSYLLEHGAMVNALDGLGWTALHIAVSGGHAVITSALLAAGGDAFAINSSGQLALHYASSRNRLDCARLLLETGGDRTAAMASFPDRSSNTPLHRAAAQGLADMVTVLVEAGAAISAVDLDGSTALHLATVEQQLAVVRLLADAVRPFDSAIRWNTLPLPTGRRFDLNGCAASHAGRRRVAGDQRRGRADRRGHCRSEGPGSVRLSCPLLF
jgi:26S proteasome non-ATPase regulatory subunit 10